MRDKHYYFREFCKREIECGGPSVGVDFYGVIIDERNLTKSVDTDPVHSVDIYMKGVFESIQRLVEITDRRVWVIIGGSELRSSRGLDWLNKVDFYYKTGLEKKNVILYSKCKDKVEICRRLNINYFIGSQLHAIQLLQESIPYLFLFGEKERKEYKTLTSLVAPVFGWEQCLISIMGAMSEMRKYIDNIK